MTSVTRYPAAIHPRDLLRHILEESVVSAAKLARFDSKSATLHFIELPSAEYAIQRVARRVAAGGHAIPDEDVRRRYGRGLELFKAAYSQQVARWFHWFSDDEGLKIVDRKQS